MADDFQGVTLRQIQWREVFPFVNIFRAFRVAVHPSKLFLGVITLLLLYCGGRALDAVWPTNHMAMNGDLGVYTNYDEMSRQGVFKTFFNYEVSQVNAIAEAVYRFDWFGPQIDPRFGMAGITSPMVRGNVIDSTVAFLMNGPAWLFREHPLFAALFTIWFLMIWSVFGGAIARIAAVHVARDEKISVRQALRFSAGKALSFIFAPVIPLVILLLIGALLALGGWILLHIPAIGPIILGVLFFLALGAGFVMTLVLVGTVGGFNLMYPTVAVEGSDSFDAISRSFSYVYARPWRMIFYTAVAIAYGAVTYLFVRFFLWLMLALTHFFIGWWLGNHHQAAIYWKGIPNPLPVSIWPMPGLGSMSYTPDYAHLKWSESAAATFIWIWVYIVIGILGAFVISFYFSANTIIYYLMRREVDATDVEDVYVEESEEDFSEAPPPESAAKMPPSTATSSTAVSEEVRPLEPPATNTTEPPPPQ